MGRIRGATVASLAALVLLAGGCVFVAPTTRTASNAPRDNACLPAQEATSIDSGPGAFKAASEGNGTGDATLQPAAPAVEQDSQGRLRWELGVNVTGNTPTVTSSTLFGTLDFKLTLGNGQKIDFESRCIIEAGVFNTTEEDPFGDVPPNGEVVRQVRRGIEGEWLGTAKNFPAPGQSSQVVAAIATWTTAAGPRFKVDIATSTAACLGESVPNAGIGGPTSRSVRAEISAPNLDAGRSTCSQQQQQQQAND
jgi:hypothetical protein